MTHPPPPPPFPQVRRHCVSQVNVAGTNMVDYDFKDVEYMANVSGCHGNVMVARSHDRC